MDLASVGVAVSIIVGLGALLALASRGARGSELRATVEVLQLALQTERNERVESERRHEREVAELRGQVVTLTATFARTIAHEVVGVMRRDGVLPGGER